MKQRVVLCDFDGTLINGDLERMFMRYLLRRKEVRYKMLLASCLTLPLNLLMNTFGYPSVFKSWTLVLGDSADEYIRSFLLVENKFISQKESGWRILKSVSNAKCILLTGCYGALVRAYLKCNHLEEEFDEVISTEMSNRLLIRQHPYARGKVKFVNPANYNIGIANEYADHYYLDLCDEVHYVC